MESTAAGLLDTLKAASGFREREARLCTSMFFRYGGDFLGDAAAILSGAAPAANGIVSLLLDDTKTPSLWTGVPVENRPDGVIPVASHASAQTTATNDLRTVLKTRATGAPKSPPRADSTTMTNLAGGGTPTHGAMLPWVPRVTSVASQGRSCRGIHG